MKQIKTPPIAPSEIKQSIYWQQVNSLLDLALAEDLGHGDVTSELLLANSLEATMAIRNRQPMVMAASFVVPLIYEKLASFGAVSCDVRIQDGEYVSESTELAVVTGNAKALLAGERLVLNILQRCCAIATRTREFVLAVQEFDVAILDTRKTMPAFRYFDKYSVLCGGGNNHRFCLDEMILIKDNHIALCGSISAAIEAAKLGNKKNLPIEVECDNIQQVEEALQCGVDWVLLDNMPVSMLHLAVERNQGRAKLEASGGVNLQTVKSIAATGVDAISVGELTHSAIAVDIGMDMIA